MKRTKYLTEIFAIAVVSGFAAASVANAAPGFSSAVTEVLMQQTEGPIAEMSGEEKQAMIDCVVGVLAGLPDAKKDYVAQGASAGEREDRFGEVVMENRAEWKQKITKECGERAS